MGLGSSRLTARLARPAPTSYRRDRSMIFGPRLRALPALVRRDMGGGDGRSGAFGRWCHGCMTGAATGRQIGSECLIMPDTRPGQPIVRHLSCSGRGSSIP
jgi:hypothetical protein